MTSAKQILEKNKNEDDRTKVSLYLSKTLFDKFKRSCKGASASKVMEDLMRIFLESLKKDKDLEI